MCGGIRKGIKTVIAKIDMKVLRRAGLMTMIVELHIARTVAGNGLKLIAHGDFAVIPDIGGIARAGVFGDVQGLPIAIVKGDGISLNGYGNCVTSPYGDVLFTNGVHRNGRVIRFPGLMA